MSASRRPKGQKPPHNPGNTLSRIFESAKDFVSMLGPLDVAASPPWPVATPSYPELVLEDVKRPSQKFSKLKIPTPELRQVLQTYRKRLDVIRRKALHEYGLLCHSQPHTVQLQITSAFSEYWIGARNALLERTVEMAAKAAAMVPPGQPTKYKTFNKEFVPMFEFVFAQLETGHLTIKDKKFLATLSDMEYRQITVWFQNRRARIKQKLQSGKSTPPPPSLEETAAKLRDLIAKADAKSSNEKEVVLIKEKRVAFEAEVELEDGAIEMPIQDYSLDLYNERLSLQFGGVEPPTLDCWAPSPGCFPEPFAMPKYDMPSFAPPRWPRAPQIWLPPQVPVVDSDLADITLKLETVTITPPTTVVQGTVTITQTMTAATAARCNLTNKVLNSVRSFIPRPKPRRPKPKIVKKKLVAPTYVLKVTPVQGESDPPQVDVQASLVSRILNKLGVDTTNSQVQVSGSQDPLALRGSEDLQISLNANPQVDQATQNVATSQVTQGDSNGQPPAATQIAPVAQGAALPDAPFDIAQDLPGICDKISHMDINIERSRVSSLMNSSSSTSFGDVDFNSDSIPAEMQVLTDQQGRVVRPDLINLPLPRLDVPPDHFMDDVTMNKVLRMTLKQLKYKGPMPSDDPVNYVYLPVLAVDPMAEQLNDTLKPYYMLYEHETTEAMYTALNGRREDFQFEPVDQPQSQPIPLPASVADSFPDLFSTEPSQRLGVDISALPTSDQFIDSEGIPLPFALNDPTPQYYYNADTSAVPTFDHLYDPQGTALPFALFENEYMAYQPPNKISDSEFVNPPFADSYMFMDTGTVIPATDPRPQTPEAQTPEEPAISFYPSYLPQVPILSEEVKRTSRSILSWLERKLGSKTKFSILNDPEDMLQYLA